jgi:hypothetical protein
MYSLSWMEGSLVDVVWYVRVGISKLVIHHYGGSCARTSKEYNFKEVIIRIGKDSL